MADMLSSPPPSPVLHPKQQAQSDRLDDEIAAVRAEIAALTKRQSTLASTLAANTNVQSQLRQNYATDADMQSLLDQQSIQAQIAVHRLAFGITSFPFIDPSPDTSNARLLGIRFDICSRSGESQQPYYVLLRRTETSTGEGVDLSSEYRVHRHTVPALVPLQKYEERYLPATDEGYGSEDGVLSDRQPEQDLMGFATSVRNDLTSWQMRKEAVEICKEQLTNEDSNKAGADEPADKLMYGVRDVEVVALDAYQVRIVWKDGHVGRVKIGDDGIIQKAAVFMSNGEEETRCRSVERVLLGGDGAIAHLAHRLKEVAATKES